MRWLIALAVMSQAKTGDKMSVTVDSTLELEILIKDGTGDSTRLLNVVRREKFAQEATATADGHVTGARIRCLSSRIQKEGSYLPPREEATGLAEKSFAAVRTENGWSVKGDDGNPPAADGQSLGSWNDAVRLLVQPNPQPEATWTVNGADAAPLLYGAALANAKGLLRCKVESVSDGKVAVSFLGAIDGEGKDGSVVIFNVSSGLLVADVAKSRPVSLNISGAVESRRDIVETYRKPGSLDDERRKVGEITAKSKRLEVNFIFQ